ncbi:glycosyltransferase family 2 protein [Streptacidiphilus monticola]|uniref:Glycosyltransferase family 2 protein n=1 Tax=Streptacidiphilus monticola TaxID=2161674 RepID=A0ABW1G3A4_9ACTN
MSGASGTSGYAVVVPTLGRPSLDACLAALAAAEGPPPARVVLVDDRPLDDCHPLPVQVPPRLADRVETVPSLAGGPAVARNTGWRAVKEPWVVFLDDDTVPGPYWARELTADLAAAGPGTAAVQGVIDVPLPPDRRPTDWERGTAGLARAAWITADLACRREALESVGGFDERFPRAFREDADLALRLMDAGWQLRHGRRHTTHPVRPAPGPWASLRAQRGNQDDALMTRLHGRDWWTRARAPRGRLPRHAAVTAAGAGAIVALACGGRRVAAASVLGWALGTGEFAWKRIAPGPRTVEEIRAMVLTSLAIPPAACAHWLLGWARHRTARPWTAPQARPRAEGDAEAGAGADADAVGREAA